MSAANDYCIRNYHSAGLLPIGRFGGPSPPKSSTKSTIFGGLRPPQPPLASELAVSTITMHRQPYAAITKYMDAQPKFFGEHKIAY